MFELQAEIGRELADVPFPPLILSSAPPCPGASNHISSVDAKACLCRMDVTLGSMGHLSGTNCGRGEQVASDLPDVAHNEEPAFFVRADVNLPSREYTEGDELYVHARCEVDAHLYIFYQQADGELNLIFPNGVQRDNRIPAKQVAQVPNKDDLFRWVVGPPFGNEVIKVIATKQPLPRIDAAVGKGRFSSISSREMQTLAGQLQDGSAQQWAESEVEIMTHPRGHVREPADGSAPKRFGVFFGVSEYKFNDELLLATDGKGSMNVATPHNDALRLAAAFSEVGQLQDRRVYVNDRATRRQMQVAITEWLPSVSRPGDTVFIQFTGHGMKIKDNNGDESDGQDEVLLPHDMVDLGVLLGMAMKAEQGKQVDPRFEGWKEMFNRLGDNEEANVALIRETGISDDLFGRWLQRLDGRRVVVILGSCHSGGFAATAKGDTEATEPLAFDFLDGEISRLKDIGQEEQALLAAAMSSEVARESRDLGMSVMPYFLERVIRNVESPVTLEQAFELCRVEVAACTRDSITNSAKKA